MLLSRESTITQGDSHEKCNTSKWRRDRPNVLSAQKRRTDYLGSMAYLKTIKNRDLKRQLIRKLYYSELQMSGNLSRYFEEFLDLRKPREKERRKWTHPYLCSD